MTASLSPTTRTLPGPDTARLFAELQDLKRLAPTGTQYSLADDLFVAAWAAVLAGQPWTEVADRTACRALLYVLFPGVGPRFFRAARLSVEAAWEVCRAAYQRTVGDRLSGATRERLSTQLPAVINRLYQANDAEGSDRERQDALASRLPPPLHALREQPRAGATHPDHPRLVLLPPESHADHCGMTAVYSTLLAADYGADPGLSFVCALAHHLHNAFLPDCGWAGELALEPYLQTTIANCRTAALAAFPAPLRDRLAAALTHHESLATPEGYAVSAGDTLDRVLDVRWRTRAAAVTDQDVLGDLDLVHPGPLKDFQTQLLNHTRLWTTP